MNYNNSEFLASYGLSSQLPEVTARKSFFGPLQRGQIQPHQQAVQPQEAGPRQRHAGQNGNHQLLPRGYGYFVDLPGYGYAKVCNADRERWDDLINSYFEADPPSACWCSCWTAATRPALTICRCWSICTTTASRLWH